MSNYLSNYSVKDAGKVPDLEPTDRIKRLQKYADERGLVYRITADDKFEMYFYDIIRQGKAKAQTFIPWIFRLKVNKQFVLGQETNEVLIWYEQRTIYQHDGEPLQLNQREGVLLHPVERKKMVNGRMVVTGTAGSTPWYLVPFSPEKVQEITSRSETEVEKFHLAMGTTKGPDVVSGIHRTIHNVDDFKEGTFEELMDMSAFNYSTKEPRLQGWRAEGEQIKKQAQTFSTLASNLQNR